jgi:hypothetical protein
VSNPTITHKEDGSLDEIHATGTVHVERMSGSHVSMSIELEDGRRLMVDFESVDGVLVVKSETEGGQP